MALHSSSLIGRVRRLGWLCAWLVTKRSLAIWFTAPDLSRIDAQQPNKAVSAMTARSTIGRADPEARIVAQGLRSCGRTGA
jgi:hypothetical protein